MESSANMGLVKVKVPEEADLLSKESRAFTAFAGGVNCHTKPFSAPD